MAFDGAFLFKTVAELKNAIDCHVEKIYQPSHDELVISLRKKGFAKKLLISAKSGMQRVHFTENKYENPAVPPMFCMLMRKYISSAKLIDIYQPELERVVIFVFSAIGEMGDIAKFNLICELISGKTNIILTDDNMKIINALRHGNIEKDEHLVLPGMRYEFPPKIPKLNPLEHNAQEISKTANNSSLLNVVCGFSPLICREIENSPFPQKTLEKILFDLKFSLKPIIIYKPDGEPLDFSYTEILQYGYDFKSKTFESFSALLDAFYTEKETVARLNANSKDILKLINNLKKRTEKKLALRLCELEKCKNRETLRIYGELIKANIHSLKRGSSFAEVPNYYSETLETIRIPLDNSLSPAANANKYFKEYKKTYTAEQTLTELTARDRDELIYFETVFDSLERATSLADIAQIREELTESGYIKSSFSPKKKKEIQNTFKEYTSCEGYKILVGKNNKQNDLITTQIASKHDLWFHVKNIAGSHVVVFCNGNEVSNETVLQAAILAAQNSKAHSSSNVAVDYTPVKYVKKPNGAKAGMVIYNTNKTVYVTPGGKLK